VRRLRRFTRATGSEKILLVRAFFVVCLIRLGLRLLPINAVQRTVIGTSKTESVIHPVNQLVWAVRAVSRFVPLATCLTQALALQWLLSRSGHASRIHLGARKDAAGKFDAHAWVECEGRVVIGGPATEEYVPLAVWQK